MNDAIVQWLAKKVGASNRSIEKILYNAIPAFMFAPVLLYYGYTFSAWPLIMIGTLLFIIDTYHFLR